MCFRDDKYLEWLQDLKKISFFIYLRRGMLHICLVTFISFISFTKVHYSSFHVTNFNTFISSFISISFILQKIIHFIHIHHIWFCSYCIAFQPHYVFHFFNQSRLWKRGVSLAKMLIWNIYCIIWSWTPMVLLLLVTS